MSRKIIHFQKIHNNNKKKNIAVCSNKVITSLGSIKKVGYCDKISLDFKRFHFWMSRGVNFSKHSNILLLFFSKIK